MYSDQLKSARAATGLSQVKAAAALGVPRRTYENWEMGVSVPAEYVRISILEKMEGMKMKKTYYINSRLEMVEIGAGSPLILKAEYLESGKHMLADGRVIKSVDDGHWRNVETDTELFSQVVLGDFDDDGEEMGGQVIGFIKI